MNYGEDTPLNVLKLSGNQANSIGFAKKVLLFAGEKSDSPLMSGIIVSMNGIRPQSTVSGYTNVKLWRRSSVSLLGRFIVPAWFPGMTQKCSHFQ